MNPDGSNYQIVHAFAGGTADGSGPNTSLTLIGSVLYGTTAGGGAASGGTIFSMSVDGSNFQVLHSFSTDFQESAHELSYSPSLGAVFGTTTFGGANGSSNADSSAGAVFSINADGSNFEILHTFTDSMGDGGYPEGGLTAVGTTIYGTTEYGGSPTSGGTIFSLSADGSHYQVLHAFTGALGIPLSDLTVVDSTLYGTTDVGNAVFSMSTSGANFLTLNTSPSGYTYPSAVTLVGTILVGTTQSGGPDNDGTIFSMNVDGSNLQFIHEYPYASHDGSHPESDLTLVGNVLYGTTLAGGTVRGGTLFSMNVDGSNLQILHSFTGGRTDGIPGIAGLSVIGSVLYGTTSKGGSANDGTIFSINLDGSNYQVLHMFTGSTTDGANPLAGLTPVGSVLFGTTELGGPGSTGTIFSINADGSNFQIVHAGGYPVAPLTLVGSTLYGTTAQGGSANSGAVFSMNSDGANYQVLYSFPSQPTLIPGSKLTVVGSTLYGMTGGGTEPFFEVISTPAIFSLNLDGSNFQILHTFAGGTSDGSRSPIGSLTAVGSTLFGTALGGPTGNGIVFSMNDDGANYQIVHAFSGGPDDGASPYSSFVQVGTTLFGTASRGREMGGMIYALTLPAPQVTGVQVASSSWNADFLTALQAGGMGNGSGYAIPTGSSAQLQDLPWTNLDQIQITFNENVDVQEDSLVVMGQNGASYAFSGFSYNPTTFVATWTLASAIGADRLSLNLQSSGGAAVTNVLGTALDGEWADGARSFPSGDGATGGDFHFGFSVLPGDVNQDGILNSQDIALVSSNWLGVTQSDRPVTGDINGDGIVNAQDIAAVSSNWLATLPGEGNSTAQQYAVQSALIASGSAQPASADAAPAELMSTGMSVPVSPKDVARVDSAEDPNDGITVIPLDTHATPQPAATAKASHATITSSVTLSSDLAVGPQAASFLGTMPAASPVTSVTHLRSEGVDTHHGSYSSWSLAGAVDLDPANVNANSASFDETDLPIDDELLGLLASSIRRHLDQR